MKTITILLTAAALAGCAKSTLDTQLMTEADYCPMSVGSWIDYDVTAIAVDVATDYYDTARYIMREEVDAVLDSSAEEQKYRIIRKIRFLPNSEWQDLDAVLVVKNAHALIRQENNIPVIAISYPAAVHKRWNGNAMNTQDSASFIISSISSGQSFSGTDFDSVLTVVQADLETLIDIERKSERYVAGIGLVEKSSTAASISEPIIGSDGKPLPVLAHAEKASIFQQTFRAHGKN